MEQDLGRPNVLSTASPAARAVTAGYGRGRYRVMAVEAVARLRKQGFRAVLLDIGVVDWQAQGLPVEQGPGVRSEPN